MLNFRQFLNVFLNLEEYAGFKVVRRKVGNSAIADYYLYVSDADRPDKPYDCPFSASEEYEAYCEAYKKFNVFSLTDEA